MKVKKHIVKFLAAALAACISAALLGTALPGRVKALESSTLATGKITSGEEGSALTLTDNLGASKSASATSESGQYNINFSIPATEYEKDSIDVVLVLDKSLSPSNAFQSAAKNFVSQMETKAAGNKNFVINLGLLYFNMDVHDMMNDKYGSSLVRLTGEAGQESEIDNLLAVRYTSGTNIDGAVTKAKTILDNDTATASSKKYMVVLSDYAGTKLDDGTGTGKGNSTYYRQSATSSGASPTSGTADFMSKYGDTGSSVNLTGLTASNINALITSGTLLNGVAGDMTYLSGCGDNAGEFRDGFGAFPAASLSRVPVASVAFQPNSNIPTIRERSIYRTAKALLAVKNAKYNFITVTKSYYPNLANLYAMSNAFQSWIGTNIGTRYDIANTEDYSTVFTKITGDIFYVLASGKLTDTIGENFTFVKGNETLALGSTAQKKTELSVSGYDYSVGFGDMDANGKYPYVMHYKNDAGTETVTLEINVPVTKDAPLKLSFTEKVKDTYTFSGSTVTIPTNQSAGIDYVDSASKSHRDDFVSPKVTFTQGEITAVSSPKTGDSSGIGFLIILLLAACPVLICAVSSDVRKRHAKE